jgi:hypothetical protein
MLKMSRDIFRRNFVPICLAALGIILRGIPVWLQGTWYDENFTLLVSRLPLDRLLAATAGDVHPPLWYLLVWPLAHIPALPGWAVVRLPALAAGILSIWVWWKILIIMVRSDRARLVAFGLFCLLPTQIYYSQEGRMYSLFTLLVLLAWLCILEGRFIYFAIAVSSILWLHNYGLFYAAALWAAGMIYDKRKWRALTIASIAAGISFIPWVIILLGQMGNIAGGYWILRLSIPSIFGNLAHSYFGGLYLAADMLTFAVFYGVFAWVIVWALRRRDLNLPALAMALLPLILAAIVSMVWRPIMLYRALIPSAAFICLILAEPFQYLGRRPALLLAIFFIPALVVNIAAIEARHNWNSSGDPDPSIQIIDRSWQKGDLLYYVDDGVFISGSVAWANIDNTLQVEDCGPVLGGLSKQTQNALGMKVGPLPDNYPGRVWVITAETPLNPICMDDYLEQKGLLNSDPLYCSSDNELVRSCLYLVQ